MRHELPRIGYVVKCYPRFSETFIVNELLALERLGADIEIFSLRPAADSHFHAALAELRAPVHYLPSDSPKGETLWRGLLAARAIPLERALPIHRGLHEGQPLISDELEIAMLDLDTLAGGDPVLDLANLLAHLELRALAGRGRSHLALRIAGRIGQPLPGSERRSLGRGHHIAAANAAAL